MGNIRIILHHQVPEHPVEIRMSLEDLHHIRQAARYATLYADEHGNRLVAEKYDMLHEALMQEPEQRGMPQEVEDALNNPDAIRIMNEHLDKVCTEAKANIDAKIREAIKQAE